MKKYLPHKLDIFYNLQKKSKVVILTQIQPKVVMKKIILSVCLAFQAISYADIPLDQIDFNKHSQTLENHIFDMIDGLDDQIAVMEHTTTHYDNITIYQMGYQFGKRRAYYDMLEYLRTTSLLELPK